MYKANQRQQLYISKRQAYTQIVSIKEKAKSFIY